MNDLILELYTTFGMTVKSIQEYIETEKNTYFSIAYIEKVLY